MRYSTAPFDVAIPSPLAEGRELKLRGHSFLFARLESPLAEGRELK